MKNHWNHFIIIFPGLLLIFKFIIFLTRFKGLTPFEMLKNGKDKGDIIIELRKLYSLQDSHEELMSMENRIKEEMGEQPKLKDLWKKNYRKQLGLGVVIIFAFQFTGAITLTSYPVLIFQEA